MLVLVQDVMTHNEFIILRNIIKDEVNLNISADTPLYECFNVLEKIKNKKYANLDFKYLKREFVHTGNLIRSRKTLGSALLLSEFNDFILRYNKYESWFKGLFTAEEQHEMTIIVEKRVKDEHNNFSKVKEKIFDFSKIPLYRIYVGCFNRVKNQNLVFPALSDSDLVDFMDMYAIAKRLFNRVNVYPIKEKI